MTGLVGLIAFILIVVALNETTYWFSVVAGSKETQRANLGNVITGAFIWMIGFMFLIPIVMFIQWLGQSILG